MSILKYAHQFDLFTHAGALFQLLTCGPAVQFNVYPGVASFEVAAVLRQHGIRYWAMIRMSNGLLAFRVSPGEGRHCNRVLAENGIGYMSEWRGCGPERRPRRRRRRR